MIFPQTRPDVLAVFLDTRKTLDALISGVSRVFQVIINKSE
jgi:hypothetical protein